VPSERTRCSFRRQPSWRFGVFGEAIDQGIEFARRRLRLIHGQRAGLLDIPLARERNNLVEQLDQGFRLFSNVADLRSFFLKFRDLAGQFCRGAQASTMRKRRDQQVMALALQLLIVCDPTLVSNQFLGVLIDAAEVIEPDAAEHDQ